MAGLSTEQVERFRRDGYLIVDGLFDTESLEPVRRRIRELATPDAPEMVKAKRQVEPSVEAGEMRADGYAASLRKMSHMAFEDPVFLAHASTPRIVDIIESLLGPDFVLAQDQLFMKPPRVGSRQAFHQDTPLGFHLDPPDRMVTCWCTLDEATIANGCLWMIPGSHLDGVTDTETWQRYEPVDGVEPPEARPVELAAGSCSFHHGLILHASRPNLTDRSRWGYATHYASARCRFEGEAGDHVHPRPALRRLRVERFCPTIRYGRVHHEVGARDHSKLPSHQGFDSAARSIADRVFLLVLRGATPGHHVCARLLSQNPPYVQLDRRHVLHSCLVPHITPN